MLHHVRHIIIGLAPNLYYYFVYQVSIETSKVDPRWREALLYLLRQLLQLLIPSLDTKIHHTYFVFDQVNRVPYYTCGLYSHFKVIANK